MGYSWGSDPRVGVRTFTEAVRFIAAQTQGAERLLALHRPDAHGRCLGCTTPGTGTARQRWPCALATLADAAAHPPP